MSVKMYMSLQNFIFEAYFNHPPKSIYITKRSAWKCREKCVLFMKVRSAKTWEIFENLRQLGKQQMSLLYTLQISFRTRKLFKFPTTASSTFRTFVANGVLLVGNSQICGSNLSYKVNLLDNSQTYLHNIKAWDWWKIGGSTQTPGPGRQKNFFKKTLKMRN